jgi:hypothetical protein
MPRPIASPLGCRLLVPNLSAHLPVSPPQPGGREAWRWRQGQLGRGHRHRTVTEIFTPPACPAQHNNSPQPTALLPCATAVTACLPAHQCYAILLKPPLRHFPCCAGRRRWSGLRPRLMPAPRPSPLATSKPTTMWVLPLPARCRCLGSAAASLLLPGLMLAVGPPAPSVPLPDPAQRLERAAQQAVGGAGKGNLTRC